MFFQSAGAITKERRKKKGEGGLGKCWSDGCFIREYCRGEGYWQIDMEACCHVVGKSEELLMPCRWAFVMLCYEPNMAASHLMVAGQRRRHLERRGQAKDMVFPRRTTSVKRSKSERGTGWLYSYIAVRFVHGHTVTATLHRRIGTTLSFSGLV